MRFMEDNGKPRPEARQTTHPQHIRRFHPRKHDHRKCPVLTHKRRNSVKRQHHPPTSDSSAMKPSSRDTGRPHAQNITRITVYPGSSRGEQPRQKQTSLFSFSVPRLKSYGAQLLTHSPRQSEPPPLPRPPHHSLLCRPRCPRKFNCLIISPVSSAAAERTGWALFQVPFE